MDEDGKDMGFDEYPILLLLSLKVDEEGWDGGRVGAAVEGDSP